MAEENIILKVGVDVEQMQKDLSTAIKSVTELKEKQKELTKEIIAGNDADGQMAKQLAEVSSALEKNQREVKSKTAVIQAATAANLKENASLDEQRQALNLLQKAAGALTDEQRTMDVGGTTLNEHIKKLTESIKAQEHAIGDDRRNVGNYTESLMKAIPSLKGVSGVLNVLGVDITKFSGGFVKGMQASKASAMSLGKAMLTPPVAVISAILIGIMGVVKLLSAGFDKLKEAFEKNDVAGTNLARALAVLQPIGDALTAVFNSLAEGLGTLCGWFADGVSAVTDFFGALVTGEENYESSATKCMKLVEAIDALEEAERHYTEQSAKNSRDIAEYRSMADEAADPKKKKEYLQKAIDLEAANLEEFKRIKAEQVRIMEETAKREQDTSDATKNKIAQARAEMYRAEEAYYTGVRKLQKELRKVDEDEEKRVAAEQKKRDDAAKKAADEAKKKAEEAAKEAKRKREEAARAAKQKRKEEADRLKAEADALEKEAEEIAKRQRTALEQQVYEYEQAMNKELSTKRLTEEQKRQITEYYTNKIKEARDADEKDKIEARKRARVEAGLDPNKTPEEEELEKLTKLREDDLISVEEYEEAKAKIEEKYATAALEAKKNARLKFGLDEDKTPEEQELDLLQVAREQDLLNAEEYEKAKTLIHEKYVQERADKTKEEVQHATELYQQSVSEAASSTSAALSALSNLLGEYADSSEEAAKAQKAFAFGSILINQAMSIAEGAKAIAAAMAGAAEAAAATGPAAPFTLIAYQAQMVGQVLAMVASVASTIVQAKQTFNEAKSYSTGGIIGGRYSDGDIHPAMLAGQEMVINPKQQKTLFDIANSGASGYAYESMKAAMTAAVAEMPAPNLAITELADAQKRVTTYTQIANI